MEIAFATRKLRTICEDETEPADEFDAGVAKQLKGRLADLRAANTVHDLVVGNPTIVPGAAPQMTIDLPDGYKLVARPNHHNIRAEEDGSIDWRRVRRLLVVGISR